MKNKIAILIKKEYRIILFCLFISVICITLFSYNSFLFPMNNMHDVDCYYTMGLGLLNHKIPYIDLFDHKGPLLYFIYALMVAIDKNGFLGGYLVEVLFYFIFTYNNYKICNIYTKNNNDSIIVSFLVSLLIASSTSFFGGGSVEELILPVLNYSLYRFLLVINTENKFSASDAFVIGIMTSIAFYIKYTICSFFVGLLLFSIVIFIIDKYEIKQVFLLVKNYILGFLIISVPIAVYLVASNSLKEMINIYIINNIFNYGSIEGSVIDNISWCVYNTFIENYKFMIWYVFIFMNMNTPKRKKEILMICLCCLLMSIFLFSSGRYYDYYSLVFCVFSICGISYFYSLIKNSTKCLTAAIVFCLIISIMDINTDYIKTTRDELPQYKFMRIVNNKKNIKLLCYGELDSGFYYVIDCVPQWKYFYLPNIDDDVFINEQNRIIKMAEADYIISRADINSKYYKKIYEDSNSEYILYKKY